MKFVLALCLCLVTGTASAADIGLTLTGVSKSSSTYTGPLDIVPNATAWYGLRGASAAYAATGTGKAINYRRASDNATQDGVILTTGAFDIASYNTFVGTDATCTGSMVGTTTLTISSCASGTLHVNDPISGAGITQPAFITNIGSCASPPGTCTVNVAQTFASETVTAQVAGFATEAYDQTGNGNHLLQATAANQPQILPVCINSLPCLRSAASNSVQLAGSISSLSQPLTISSVTQDTSNGATETDVLSTGTSLGGLSVGAAYINVNAWRMYAGSGANSTIARTTASAIQSVYNTTSSAINVNGTDTTGLSVGSNTTGTFIEWMGRNSQTISYQSEVGLWNSAFTLTQRSNMHTNQSAYWGTP